MRLTYGAGLGCHAEAHEEGANYPAGHSGPRKRHKSKTSAAWMLKIKDD